MKESSALLYLQVIYNLEAEALQMGGNVYSEKYPVKETGREKTRLLFLSFFLLMPFSNTKGPRHF